MKSGIIKGSYVETRGRDKLPEELHLHDSHVGLLRVVKENLTSKEKTDAIHRYYEKKHGVKLKR
jgi:hypothetical protein